MLCTATILYKYADNTQTHRHTFTADIKQFRFINNDDRHFRRGAATLQSFRKLHFYSSEIVDECKVRLEQSEMIILLN